MSAALSLVSQRPEPITLATLPISEIRRDGGTQLRAGTNEDTILAYVEAMRAGAVFPPVVVYRDDAGGCWLADGFQRIDAATRCGRTEIAADVRVGTVRDAILHAVGCNDTHGLRRTKTSAGPS